MFKKAILSVAAVSVLATGLYSTAEAASNSTTVRDHRTKIVVRDHRTKQKVRDHRTKKVIRDHRTKRQNEVVVVTRKKLPCRLGVKKLRWNGFKGVRSYDCKGNVYGYRAHKGTGIYNATMSASTGRISVKFIGFAH